MKAHKAYGLAGIVVLLVTAVGCGGGNPSQTVIGDELQSNSIDASDHNEADSAEPSIAQANQQTESAESAGEAWQIQSNNGYHLVKETVFDNLGEVYSVTRIEHDFVGNTSRSFVDYPNSESAGDPDSLVDLTYYDVNGNITKRENYFSNGGLSDTFNYTLDNDLVVEIVFGFGVQRFEYNNRGALLLNQQLSGGRVRSESQVKFNGLGQPNNMNIFDYDTGKENQDGKPSSSTSTSFVLNEAGQIIQSSGTGRYSKTVYSYDEHNNIVSKEVYSHSNKVVRSYFYEYARSPKPRVNAVLLKFQQWMG